MESGGRRFNCPIWHGDGETCALVQQPCRPPICGIEHLCEMNMSDTDSWQLSSNFARQLALALLATVLGLILVIGFRHFGAAGFSNSLAGFLLGVLLLVVGLAALLTQGRQTVVIDPRGRSIVIEDETPFGNKTRVIRFDEIADTGIGYLGKTSSFVNFYYIVLRLRNGRKYSLFPPGRFYDGWSDRPAMEARRQRLERMLRESPPR